MQNATQPSYATKEAAESAIAQQGYQFHAFTGGMNVYISPNGKCCAAHSKTGWHINQWSSSTPFNPEGD